MLPPPLPMPPPLPPMPPWHPDLRQSIYSLRQDPWTAGILLDFAASLAGTLGKHYFRLGALHEPNGCKWYVTGAFLAVLVDPVLDMLAFAFSTQTIVSACVGFVVMWNVLLAPTLLGEKLTQLRVAACVLIFTGTVLVGVFGPHEERRRSEEQYMALLGSPGAIVYLSCMALFLAFACRRWWYHTGEPHGRMWGAVLGGALAGNNFAVKCAARALSLPSSLPPCLLHYPFGPRAHPRPSLARSAQVLRRDRLVRRRPLPGGRHAQGMPRHQPLARRLHLLLRRARGAGGRRRAAGARDRAAQLGGARRRHHLLGGPDRHRRALGQHRAAGELDQPAARDRALRGVGARQSHARSEWRRSGWRRVLRCAGWSRRRRCRGAGSTCS